jgi:hypothetical protein
MIESTNELELNTAWATLGHSRSAWPVTMVLASVLSTFLARHQDNGQTATTLGRAVGAVWAASGISLFLVLFGLALAGRYETHVFLAVIGGILGSAHAASSMILRWKTQMFCALVWWAAGLAGCFLPELQAGAAFLAAVLIGQVGFGVYVMIAERRWTRSGGGRYA